MCDNNLYLKKNQTYSKSVDPPSAYLTLFPPELLYFPYDMRLKSLSQRDQDTFTMRPIIWGLHQLFSYWQDDQPLQWFDLTSALFVIRRELFPAVIFTLWCYDAKYSVVHYGKNGQKSKIRSWNKFLGVGRKVVLWLHDEKGIEIQKLILNKTLKFECYIKVF